MRGRLNMKTISLIKGFFKNFWRKYKLIFVDIDGKIDVKRLNFCCRWFAVKKYSLFKTKKGYHLYIHTKHKIMFAKVILLLLLLKTDVDYIKRFVVRARFTLFHTRRGQHNENYIYTEHI